MTEATPRPWRLDPPEDDSGLCFIERVTYETVGEVNREVGTDIICTLHNHKDGKLIVQAVNAHDDLVAAPILARDYVAIFPGIM